ncbi:MAG: Glu/Leu/Phe/Val dehydrogenase [Acidobacteria bacterium]|nr:MAG: Glu/Leu/Phe/Val dehydrogenase [Acidobacteriota bacterium]REK12187.1 MAG: Glu/Leu/Phe/Val dehydrogenase [Acidobacteriota bacterium]
MFHEFADEYGPEKVVYIYEPRSGLKGIVVIDNIAAGPAIGGIRMAADVTTAEVFRLARAMTWKNALAGLRHGGGKAGILADPHTPNKETLIRQFARGIEALEGYIPGPDMGTDETAMAWVRDEIGRSVGLSKVLGGIPLDQVGATGFGIAICGEVAQEFSEIGLEGARVAVQGFGNVGQHAARFLAERGAVLTVASDLDGTVFDPDGIDIEELVRLKLETGQVTVYPRGRKLGRDAFIDLDCDILVPAARPDVIDETNAARIKAKVILQGANIPVTPMAERILHGRGILSVPDFVANAGGVICASVEYQGGTQKQAFETIEEKVRENTREILELARAHSQMPTEAALTLAKQRVSEAMAYRRRG